jgi:hypothetical protein
VAREPKSVLVLWIVLPVCAAVSVYLSVSALIGAIRRLPVVGPVLFWVLVGVWVAGLLALIIRPLNVATMRLLGARAPRPEERRFLDRTWRDVLDQMDQPANRYTLLVVDRARANVWLHCDLGPYVVTIGEEVIDRLDYSEAAAILLQRLARQKAFLALLIGVCVWAAMPLAIVVALCVSAFRGVVKAFSLARANPKVDPRTVVGLVLYGIALIGLVVLLIISIAMAAVALSALVVALLVAWLARRAELAADVVTAHWGRGRALRRGLARLHELSGLPETRALRLRVADLFSTYAPTPKRLAHLGKVDLGYSQLENPGW